MKKKNDPKALSAKYVKLVEWSDEDRCFIGSAPPLVGQSCHGDTEEEVLRQLRDIVEEVIRMKLGHGDPLPEASAGKEYSGRFVLRLDPNLHRLLSLRAEAAGDSLNNFLVKKLQTA